MQIIHLRHHEIDFERWDESISHAINQLGYAYSWYLNVVSPGWEALVSEEYGYIMPLPVKRKYGIPYLVQPVFTQQLGIFSDKIISEEVIQLFISEIPYYSYQINLNNCNSNNEKVNIKPNFVLSLQANYDDLKLMFSKNAIRNIDKAEKNNISIDNQIFPEDFIEFYYSVEKKYFNTHEHILSMLLHEGTKNNLIQILGVRNNDNKLIAALCLLVSGQRITYLVPVSSPEGKKSCAMFLLLNDIIRKNANSSHLLDFEGSQIEGIARFYKGFGAENRPYYVLKKFRPSFLVGKL